MVCFAIQLDLVRLHHFLNCLSDITQTHVNASVLKQNQQDMTSGTLRTRSDNSLGICGLVPTLIPVFVASFTASNSLSYFGLNVTVKAQSMIRPADTQPTDNRMFYFKLRAINPNTLGLHKKVQCSGSWSLAFSAALHPHR